MTKLKRSFFGANSFYLFVTLLGLGAAWGMYRIKLASATPTVFQVDQQALSYGETQLQGVLLKDSPMGKPGLYILSTADGHTIHVDSTNLDDMVGLSVTISGELIAPVDANYYPTMTAITKITSTEE